MTLKQIIIIFPPAISTICQTWSGAHYKTFTLKYNTEYNISNRNDVTQLFTFNISLLEVSGFFSGKYLYATDTSSAKTTLKI